MDLIGYIGVAAVLGLAAIGSGSGAVTSRPGAALAVADQPVSLPLLSRALKRKS